MKNNPSTAAVIAEIAAERQRQVEAEGFSHAHDDAFELGQLSRAAASYALNASFTKLPVYLEAAIVDMWAWQDEYWKPTTPRRDLIKAAALIVAEIERLDRREKDPA